MSETRTWWALAFASLALALAIPSRAAAGQIAESKPDHGVPQVFLEVINPEPMDVIQLREEKHRLLHAPAASGSDVPRIFRPPATVKLQLSEFAGNFRQALAPGPFIELQVSRRELIEYRDGHRRVVCKAWESVSESPVVPGAPVEVRVVEFRNTPGVFDKFQLHADRHGRVRLPLAQLLRPLQSAPPRLTLRFRVPDLHAELECIIPCAELMNRAGLP